MQPGGSYTAQPTRSAVPSTVNLAAMLLLAVTGVLLLRAVLTYVLFDSLIDDFVEGRGDTALPREVVEEGAPAYKAIALINAVLFGGLLALCAVFVLRGAGWARIVATVVGVLGILGGVVAVLQPATALFKVLGVVVALALVAAVVLLWLAPSSAYFRAARGR